LQAFVTTIPTTQRGMSAMLSYLLEPQWEYAVDADEMKTVLATLGVAVASMAGPGMLNGGTRRLESAA
jgi:hypothetical protein